MLRNLRLVHVRCHSQLELHGFERINLFLGANGQGKSTLLEAIHLLARCRSYRTSHHSELTRWNEKDYSVRGEYEGESFHKLAFTWIDGMRVLGVDEIEKATLQEYWGLCTAVIFKNRDLALVQERAQNRRHWMDGLIASAQPQYLPIVQRYQRVLRERNALLRNPSPDRKIWEALTDQFYPLAEEITVEREHYTAQVEESTIAVLTKFAPKEELFSFRYESDFRRHAELTRQQLFEKETKFSATQIGPHRDDWDIRLFDKPLREYGSEGQQRSVALALRFAEAAVLEKVRGRTPLLLLDDILHELDDSRREHFWSLIPPQAQIFFATALPDALPGSTLAAQKWEITHGAARKI